MNSEQKHSKTPLDLTWLDIEKFGRFATETGKILPRKFTGLTAKQQRHVSKMIKRARNMLLHK